MFHAGFPTNYEVEPGVLSNPADRMIWFPPESSDGATARVQHADGCRWFGYFPWERSPASATPFHATPDPDILLYCGYSTSLIVPTNAPERFRELDFWCPMLALPAPAVGALVLVNYVEIGVFDGREVQWVSPRISYDGFDEVRVDGSAVKGLAWAASTDRWYEFELDLMSRDLRGEAYPM